MKPKQNSLEQSKTEVANAEWHQEYKIFEETDKIRRCHSLVVQLTAQLGN